jgi:hypothetical protein
VGGLHHPAGGDRRVVLHRRTLEEPNVHQAVLQVPSSVEQPGVPRPA